jgi:hypothetical protein
MLGQAAVGSGAQNSALRVCRAEHQTEASGAVRGRPGVSTLVSAALYFGPRDRTIAIVQDNTFELYAGHGNEGDIAIAPLLPQSAQSLHLWKPGNLGRQPIAPGRQVGESEPSIPAARGRSLDRNVGLGLRRARVPAVPGDPPGGAPVAPEVQVRPCGMITRDFTGDGTNPDDSLARSTTGVQHPSRDRH